MAHYPKSHYAVRAQVKVKVKVRVSVRVIISVTDRSGSCRVLESQHPLEACHLRAGENCTNMRHILLSALMWCRHTMHGHSELAIVPAPSTFSKSGTPKLAVAKQGGCSWVCCQDLLPAAPFHLGRSTEHGPYVIRMRNDRFPV